MATYLGQLILLINMPSPILQACRRCTLSMSGRMHLAQLIPLIKSPLIIHEAATDARYQCLLSQPGQRVQLINMPSPVCQAYHRYSLSMSGHTHLGQLIPQIKLLLVIHQAGH